MAAASVNIYSPLLRLREDNQLLLSKLKQGQNDTWEVLKRMQSANDSFGRRTLGETSFTFRGVDRTPLNVVRRTEDETSKVAQTSTPKSYGHALVADGNDRGRRTSVVPASIMSSHSNRKKVLK